MKATHETLIIVGTAAGVFFGSLAGGMTGYIAALGVHTTANTVTVADATTIGIVQQALPSVVSIQIQQQDDTGAFVDTGGGTGFFVSTDGLILTNKHVVSDDTARYVVVTDDQKEHVATVLAKDPFLDLAVVKIDGSGYPMMPLGNSDAVQIGETVMAIGNSLSEFPNSVTKGIISGVNRTISAGDPYSDQQEVIEQAIQTDAAISAGNSGGPLIDLNGQAVGVDTAVSAEGQSLGFAVPINVAKKIVSDVEKYGRIIRPWLGVHYLMIDPTVKAQYHLTLDQGAFVLPDDKGTPSVVAGSPADKAGLKAGDIITSVNNVTLDDQTSLSQAVGAFMPGEQISLGVTRNGAAMTVSVTLEEFTSASL